MYELSGTIVTSPPDDKQEPVALTTLSRPLDTAQESKSKELLYVGIVGVGYYMFFSLITLSDPLSRSAWPVTAFVGGSVVTLIALSGIARKFHHLAQAGFNVTADSAGLSIRSALERGHEQRILWSEVRGFARFVY